MSKLTSRSKKDIFYPSTGLEKDRNKKPVKKLTGENTSKIKKDRSGKDYSLVRETTENFIKGDTIRPGNLPRVDDFIQGGDYKVKETPESKKRATDEPRTFSPVRLENDYSSMKSMGQAIAKWTSPNKLTGKSEPLEKVEKRGNDDSLIGQKSDLIKPEFRGEEEYKKEKINKAKKDSATKKEAEKVKKEKRREKATDITQGIGRAMAAAGGTTVKTPSKTASQRGQEQRDKKKKDEDKEKVKDSSQKGLESLELGKKNK